MKIGLFFGSFNPVHIGHLALANYIVAYTDLNELWFVVSPHNPLKKKESLLDDYQRLELLHRAIGNEPMFRVSDIEFNMPKPSYTADSLAYLRDKFPMHNFSLIMGADNLVTFHKWKNRDIILKNHKRYIYPRPGVNLEEYKKDENIEVVDAPNIEISSSFIRKAIKDGKNVKYFMPPKVYEYIEEMGFYK